MAFADLVRPIGAPFGVVALDGKFVGIALKPAGTASRAPRMAEPMPRC
jgi:hypothetical protein